MSIPIFIKADSEEQMLRAMLENNLINQKRYNYWEPRQLKDGKWIVWFVDDIQEYKKNNKGEQIDALPSLEGV